MQRAIYDSLFAFTCFFSSSHLAENASYEKEKKEPARLLSSTPKTWKQLWVQEAQIQRPFQNSYLILCDLASKQLLFPGSAVENEIGEHR